MAPATDSPDRRAERSTRPQAMPRWVKVFGAVGLVLVVLFIVLHVSGHGFGGHSMHHFMH